MKANRVSIIHGIAHRGFLLVARLPALSAWALQLTVLLAVLFGCGKNNSALVPGMTYLSIIGDRAHATVAARSVVSDLNAATHSVLSVTDKDGNVMGEITLTEARLSIRDVKIKLSEESQTGDDSIHFRGPYVVDLLNDSVSPAFPAVQLQAGSYENITMKLHQMALEDGVVTEGDNLIDRSIYLEGTYTGLTSEGQVNGVSFVFEHDIDEEFDLLDGGSNTNTLDLSAVEPNQVIVAFRLVRWFQFNHSETNGDMVDFGDLDLTDGAISLDRDAGNPNDKLRDVIKKNIKESADFGKDEDGDGSLESDEDDDETDLELEN